jgi:hypothetical protein
MNDAGDDLSPPDALSPVFTTLTGKTIEDTLHHTIVSNTTHKLSMLH